MLQQESPERVQEIWTEYHSDPKKQVVSFSLEASVHDTILERVKEYPNFLFPVFGGSKEEYYLMFSQYQDRMFFLTYLEDFRKDPASAQPYMTVSMYDDLKESKGLCLARADHLPNLSPSEAKALQRTVVDAYLDKQYFEAHIRGFQDSPESFDFANAVSSLYSKATKEEA